MIVIHDSARILWLIVCICLFSSVSVWLYVWYKFYKHKHEQYFKIRGTILLHLFLILSGIYTCIETPWLVMHSWISQKIHRKDLTDRILSFSNISLADAAVWIMVIRFFKLFIDIQHSKESVKWKRQIDENYSNWILKYYPILGNAVKLSIIVSIFWCVEMLIGILIVIFDPNDEFHFRLSNWLFVLSCIWMVKIVLIIYWVAKTKGFNDYWYLAGEFKLILISMIVVVLIACVFVPLISLIIGNIDTQSLSPIIGAFWFPMCWYVMIIWVIRKNSQNSSAGNDGGDHDVQVADAKQAQAQLQTSEVMTSDGHRSKWQQVVSSLIETIESDTG